MSRQQLKEAVSSNAFPARLIIEYGQVRIDNNSRSHGLGRRDPENFPPFPKEPVIARFIREMGRMDEFGSGIRKMMKVSRAYGGAESDLTEGDVFRMVIKVPEFGNRKAPETQQVPGKSSGKLRSVIKPMIRYPPSAPQRLCASPPHGAVAIAPTENP